MAESAESASAAETKKVVNPRVEIDTSPPFESVKEAVDRFGGSGPWIPHHLFRLAGVHHDFEAFDVEKMEEQAEKLERDLTVKEQETLNVLKELEATRRFIEDLKIKLMPEMFSFVTTPDLKLESNMSIPKGSLAEGLCLCSVVSPGSMVMDLNQAKVNLNKTSVDLAVIQASVESLNQKLRRDKVLLERRTKMQVQNSEEFLSPNENHQRNRRKRDVDEAVDVASGSDSSVILTNELKQASYEAEQFKKMTEASRYEVMKAMAEIERTKNSIKMAEMRLNAAKKMEEAAKAVEAIALAEKKALLFGENSSDALLHNSDGITLSFEEYRVLTQKAKQADELCKTKFIDTNGLQRSNEAHQLEMPILEKFEETSVESKQSQEGDLLNNVGPHQANTVPEDCSSKTHGPVHRTGNNSTKFKFRNSHSGHATQSYVTKENPAPGSRSTTSIGDVLRRKFVVQDDVMVGRHVENHTERQHVSLSQMLRKQSRVVLNPTKPMADGNVEKQYFVQRKKFGFIQVPLPSKQSKKKGQPPNTR